MLKVKDLEQNEVIEAQYNLVTKIHSVVEYLDENSLT